MSAKGKITDKMRLDWLEKHEKYATPRSETVSTPNGVVTITEYRSYYGTQKLRKAIDAAIRSKKVRP